MDAPINEATLLTANVTTTRSQNLVNKLVTFESSDPDIVSVDENGYVTGHRWGSATITAASEEVVLSDKVTSIGARAFADCKDLVLINLPDGIQIGEDAFSGCDQLIIICTEGSSVQEYAEMQGIPYVIR